jgi:hypothetical protein
MAGLSSLTVEMDPAKASRLDDAGGADLTTDDFDVALEALSHGPAEARPVVAVLMRQRRDRVPRARRRYAARAGLAGPMSSPTRPRPTTPATAMSPPSSLLTQWTQPQARIPSRGRGRARASIAAR